MWLENYSFVEAGKPPTLPLTIWWQLLLSLQPELLESSTATSILNTGIIFETFHVIERSVRTAGILSCLGRYLETLLIERGCLVHHHM